MIKFYFHLQETYGQGKGGYDGTASEHLPNGPCYKIESDIREGWIYDVGGCWNGDQKDIELQLFAFWFGLEHPHFGALLISTLHDVVDDQREGLANKHENSLDNALHTCM